MSHGFRGDLACYTEGGESGGWLWEVGWRGGEGFWISECGRRWEYERGITVGTRLFVPKEGELVGGGRRGNRVVVWLKVGY